jgi:hypothetical protein
MNIEKGSFYIEVPNEAMSERIQLKLFKMGFKWASGEVIPKFTDHKFLCLDNKIITFIDDEICIKNKRQKISERDILRGYEYEY